ncbi:unnamed protein product [Hymenolepis diminuta]|uniref:Uncharacterized protein n=1 Tax=Hymenolepis diminuta TaxID=6216 RepID=A0A564Y2M1_HYMDI|nr:unnamed protein product [Hymenolepis diminuta]
MEIRISSVVGNIFTQMNFSMSTKDSKDYVKNRGILNTGMFIRTSCQISPTPLELPYYFVNLTEAIITYVRPTFNRWVLSIYLTKR